MAPPTIGAASPNPQVRENPPPRQGRTRRARGGGGHSRRSLLRFSVMLMTVRRMVTSHTSLVRRLLPFLSSMCSSLERIAVAAEGYTTTNTRSTNANAPFIGSSSTRPASSTPATASSAPSNPANPPRALSSTTTTQIRSRTRTTGTRRSLIRARTNRRMGLSRIIETHLSRRGSLRERDR
ncbi:uncharacterized protein LOC109872212 [Oncorhynchus kisutch]|uniref:uncharacterized protein LOC109872212 n=1 Tax=Oncorhynchus kisutch TaxID=8019 RepID=UPI00099FD386|nr:uncharacterized protein LOC109872212 [Oncorhynchus kisutch]XP_046201198.1 uncharacterized protein LOC124033261 isoform X2 [Oncorhynchus gorbuscha]XP_046201199.1 uncharacterized protein LOC124033261 isoform X2 [Oncorhynchus gorbuscha]